jgi:siderophore ferric iron reductase
MSANNDLSNLLDLASQALPGLNGRIGEPGKNDITHGENNRPLLRELVQHWQNTYLEAGPHYWASRCWTLLIWQPIYLSVFGVHLAAHAPSLSSFSQPVSNGFVSGFCLQDHQPQAASQDRLMRRSAAEMKAVCEHFFIELNDVLRINIKVAARLQADCLLAALIHVQSRRPQMRNAAVIDLGQRWLLAAGLEDASALLCVRLDNGEERLALNRKICCQHFRRRDGEYCSTCPKLKMEARITRIRKDFSTADNNP